MAEDLGFNLPGNSLENNDVENARQRETLQMHPVKESVLYKTPSDSPWGDCDDRGVCLSLRQPSASLMVYGMKWVEGTTLPTDYRGRYESHYNPFSH